MHPIEENAFRLLQLLFYADSDGLSFKSLEAQSGLSGRDLLDAINYLKFAGHITMNAETQLVWTTPYGKVQYSKHERERNLLSENRTVNAQDHTKIFVVYGRNSKARDALFQFLRAIGLKPIEWSQALRTTGKAAPYVGEVLDAAFSAAQAVVVLITPDDMAYLRESLRGEREPPFETIPTPQARPNVLFEAGMALGRHPDRTILVELGELRPFSDVGGRHIIRLDNSTQTRHDLAQRLETAGCPVDLTGRDWHTAGAFDAALEGL